MHERLSHGSLDLLLVPLRVAPPNVGGLESTSGPVEPMSGFPALAGSHRAEDGELFFSGYFEVIHAVLYHALYGTRVAIPWPRPVSNVADRDLQRRLIIEARKVFLHGEHLDLDGPFHLLGTAA